MFERPGDAPGALARARRLRRDMPQSLRKLKLNIRRQAPMGRYIVDFVHHPSRLVIEVDGARHDLPEAQLHDVARDAWFATQGYRTMRIDDREAFGAPYAVADRIAEEIYQAVPQLRGRGVGVASPGSSHQGVGDAPPSPTLPPLRGKGE
jgi:very-short-patch-repair endonuclease